MCSVFWGASLKPVCQRFPACGLGRAGTICCLARPINRLNARNKPAHWPAWPPRRRRSSLDLVQRLGVRDTVCVSAGVGAGARTPRACRPPSTGIDHAPRNRVHDMIPGPRASGPLRPGGRCCRLWPSRVPAPPRPQCGAGRRRGRGTGPAGHESHVALPREHVARPRAGRHRASDKLLLLLLLLDGRPGLPGRTAGPGARARAARPAGGPGRLRVNASLA